MISFVPVFLTKVIILMGGVQTLDFFLLNPQGNCPNWMGVSFVQYMGHCRRHSGKGSSYAAPMLPSEKRSGFLILYIRSLHFTGNAGRWQQALFLNNIGSSYYRADGTERENKKARSFQLLVNKSRLCHRHIFFSQGHLRVCIERQAAQISCSTFLRNVLGECLELGYATPVLFPQLSQNNAYPIRQRFTKQNTRGKQVWVGSQTFHPTGSVSRPKGAESADFSSISRQKALHKNKKIQQLASAVSEFPSRNMSTFSRDPLPTQKTNKKNLHMQPPP